jgi:two-component system response regulator FixJ
MIAVVDDDELTRNAIARVLRSSGYGLTLYASGREFLDSLARQQPLCVLLDLRMLDLDGFEVQEALMREDCTVPLIMLTADDAPANVTKARQLRAAGFLSKPVDSELLLNTIQKVISAPVRETASSSYAPIAEDAIAKLRV